MSSATLAPTRAAPFAWRTWSARLLLLPAAFTLILVFLAPLLLFLSQSVRSSTGATDVTAAKFAEVLSDPYYWQLAGNSLTLAILTTVITLCIAVPAALVMVSFRGTAMFPIIAVAVFSPLLTSVIVRSYGWMYLLSDTGVVNYILLSLGIVEEPVQLIFNWTGTIIAMVHIEMPFMLFPILSVLLQLPPAVNEASRDLGANAFATWRRVTLPLSIPGILAGSQIVLSTSLSSFATPTILGGGRVQVLPISIYSSIEGITWPLGAVQAIMLLAISWLLVAFYTRVLRVRSRATRRV